MAGIIIDIPHVLPKLYIESSYNEIYTYLKNQFSPFCYSVESIETVCDIQKIEILVNENDFLEIRYADFYQRCNKEKMISVITRIMHSILYTMPPCIILHGGMVTYNHQGMAILGKTTSGKTTLTTYLIHNGFDYYTDDIIVMDYDKRIAYPFQKPIHLREAALELLTQSYNLQLNTQRYKVLEHERFLIDIKEINKAPCSLERLVILNRQPCDKPQITVLSKELAFRSILENCYSAARLIQSITASKTIASRYDIYILTYENLEDATNLLKDFINKCKMGNYEKRGIN